VSILAEQRFVAFDVTPLQNGHRGRGIGTYVRGLAARLLEQQAVPIEFWGWDDNLPFGPLPPPHRALWLPRLGVPRTRFPSLLRSAMRIRLSLSRAAAVHLTDPNSLITSHRRTILTTVYDLIPLHQGPGAGGSAYRAYLARVRSAATVFAISQATAEDVVARLSVPQDRVVLAPPGVEIPAEVALPQPPLQGPYFLFVGSPDPHKNLALLLEALASGSLPERLAVVGGWPESSLAELRAKVEAAGLRGRVEHLGFVDATTLLSLYRSATAVVVPSLIEGFGLPVGEALAAGAPVIHSRLPVLEEVSAGEALTFSPASAEELAGCLARLSGDAQLRTDLRERGLRRARSLTWTAALESTLATYRRAVAGRLSNSS
jgi:glycosyltransferase involved in cell wall biosynthesis